MARERDVSEWIGRLAQGDAMAAENLWELCGERLVRLARRKLGDTNRRVADEEDVALSAFHSLCRAAAAGRFPQLDGRHDLWKLLMTITARKAVAQIRRGRSQKRGGGAVRGESGFYAAGAAGENAGIEQVAGKEPTPELAVLVTDQCEHLLDVLHDDSLRRVALFKLEGFTNEQVAQELGCTTRSVERKLARIRDRWNREDDL